MDIWIVSTFWLENNATGNNTAMNVEMSESLFLILLIHT